MAEIQRQRIKSLYGEIKGILNVLPSGDKTPVSPSVGEHFNAAVDELSSVSGTDYSRFKLSQSDAWPYGDDDYYDPIAIRSKTSSVVGRLEEEHGFGSAPTIGNSPIVVTMNQNQQVTVSVTPIQQVIESTDDEEIRQELESLKHEIETTKNPKTISHLLNTIQAKSWEVFIKVLPFILEHMGQTPPH